MQEVLLQKHPRAGLALQQDQREVGDLLQRVHMVEVAVVVGRGHEHGVGVEAGPCVQSRGIGGRGGKGDVHLARLQQAQHLLAAAAGDLQADSGVLLVKGLQKGQQEPTGDGVAGADDQIAHQELPGLGDLVLAGLQQADGAADVFVEKLAFAGQRNAPGAAGEQAHLQFVFQLLY